MHKKVVKSFCDASRMCILVEIAMLKASIKRTQASKPNLSCLPADNGAVQTHYFAKLLVLIVKLDFMSRSIWKNMGIENSWDFVWLFSTKFFDRHNFKSRILMWIWQHTLIPCFEFWFEMHIEKLKAMPTGIDKGRHLFAKCRAVTEVFGTKPRRAENYIGNR